jgi:hypothetical protein
MTATAATKASDAASLAVVLAAALALGLPDPRYLSVIPGSRYEPFRFQFADRPALRAWAEHFGSEVRTSPAPEDGDPGRVHVTSGFTYCGVGFLLYGFFSGA